MAVADGQRRKHAERRPPGRSRLPAGRGTGRGTAGEGRLRGWGPYLAAGVAGLAVVGALAVVSMRGTAGGGSSPATSPDASAVAAAAAVRLPASDGSTVSLDSLRGRKAVLYFYEGASCGTCQTGLVDLQRTLPAITAAGGTVVGVTTDPVAESTSLTQGLGVSFPVVEDQNHVLGSAFGLYEESGHMGAVDAHGVVVLDAQGHVAWLKNASSTMYVSVDDVLSALKAA